MVTDTNNPNPEKNSSKPSGPSRLPSPIIPASGTVEDRSVRERLLRSERAEAEQRAEAIISRNNVHPRFKSAGRDTINVPTETRAAYIEKLDRLWRYFTHTGIVGILGPRGTGKTHMACALVNAYCRAMRYALYAEAMDYFIAIQCSYHPKAEITPIQIEEKFLRPELLVLDAMEERAETEWNDRMLVRLINKRYAHNKTTLLISNEQEKKFTQRVGESISDRIFDGGGIIVCDWESLRGRIAE